MSNDSVIGKINQSLYFARLHTDNARALSRSETSANTDNIPPANEGAATIKSSTRFLRQQQQCYLEAAVECLYRAVFFLALQLMDKGDLPKQLKQNPEQLRAILNIYIQQTPSPEINKLLQALDNSRTLGFLLASRQSIWADKNHAIASPAAEIQLVDISLSVESCEQWGQMIADMLADFQHSNTEL